MRAPAPVKTRLLTISHCLDNRLIIAIVLALPLTAVAQSSAQLSGAAAGVPAVKSEICESGDSVLGFERKIRQLVNSSQWRELETVGSQIVQLCPDSDIGYHWIGVSYLRQGRSFAAIRAFEDSLRRRDDAGAHLLLTAWV